MKSTGYRSKTNTHNKEHGKLHTVNSEPGWVNAQHKPQQSLPGKLQQIS